MEVAGIKFWKDNQANIVEYPEANVSVLTDSGGVDVQFFWNTTIFPAPPVSAIITVKLIISYSTGTKLLQVGGEVLNVSVCFCASVCFVCAYLRRGVCMCLYSLRLCVSMSMHVRVFSSSRGSMCVFCVSLCLYLYYVCSVRLCGLCVCLCSVMSVCICVLSFCVVCSAWLYIDPRERYVNGGWC